MSTEFPRIAAVDDVTADIITTSSSSDFEAGADADLFLIDTAVVAVTGGLGEILGLARRCGSGGWLNASTLPFVVRCGSMLTDDASA